MIKKESSIRWHRTSKELLGELGFQELGVKERPGLVVLRQNKNAGTSDRDRIYKFGKGQSAF